MKKYLLLFIAAGFGLNAMAQDNKTPYMIKALNTGIKHVYVSTSGGSIHVSGESGQEPRVEVYITDNHGMTPSKEVIEKRLQEDYTLEVTVNGDEVKAVAKSKHNGDNWNWNRGLNIAFTVYVPQNVTTNLETSGGSIHIAYLNGEEKFETSGGSLHVDHLAGNIHGRTSGGSISVSNSKDNIDLETSGGSVHADYCSGTIRLETSGGSLNLNNLDGKINAETSGGSVHADEIKGELKTGTSGGSISLTRLACSLDTYTSGGSIHAQFTEVSKFVKIDASSGNVELQLPSKQGYDLNIHADRVTAAYSTSFSGTKDKDKLEGKLNGGGIAVDVNGSNHVNLNVN